MVKIVQTADLPPPPSRPEHWDKAQVLVGDYFVKRSHQVLLRVSKVREVGDKPTAMLEFKIGTGPWRTYDEFYQLTLLSSNAFVRVPPEDIGNWRDYL